MSLTLERVRAKFPEAQESFRGFGKCFIVHCWGQHRNGGRYEMEINAENGFYHCHNCGMNGDATKDFFDPLEEEMPWLFVQRDVPTQQEEQKPRARAGGIMWTPTVEAPGECYAFWQLPDDHVAVEYLRNRGFDVEEFRNAFDPANRNLTLNATRALYYCSKGHFSFTQGKGTTTGRIIFPIYMAGTLLGWQARLIDRKVSETVREVWNGFSWKTVRKVAGEWADKYVPKYYTMPGLHRSSVLYNFDIARQYDEVAVAEGPLDVLRTGPACVGTIGKAVTPEQIRLLKSYWKTLTILRDPEVDPTELRFKKLLAELSPLKVWHMVLADGKDPGATPRDSTWQQIREFQQQHP